MNPRASLNNAPAPRAWRRRPIDRGLRIFLPAGHRLWWCRGGRIYMDLAESHMMLMRLLGLYEPGKHRILRPGDVFVDAGANKGDFTLYAAKRVGPRGQVVAVEPAPSNVAWLQRTIAASGLPNVRVEPVALAEQGGSATLHLGPRSGWHTLEPYAGFDEEGTVTVTTVALDELVDHVDVLKIDVEGAELGLLTGAKRVLSVARAVLVDVHPAAGVRSQEVVNVLSSAGLEPIAHRPTEVIAVRRPTETT